MSITWSSVACPILIRCTNLRSSFMIPNIDLMTSNVMCGIEINKCHHDISDVFSRIVRIVIVYFICKNLYIQILHKTYFYIAYGLKHHVISKTKKCKDGYLQRLLIVHVYLTLLVLYGVLRRWIQCYNLSYYHEHVSNEFQYTCDCWTILANRK